MGFLSDILECAWMDGYRKPHDVDLLGEIAHFAIVTEQVRHVFGGWSVSGGRSPERNAELAPQGSHPLSLHQWGLSDDQVYRSTNARDRAWECYEVAGFGGYKRDDGVSLHVQRWRHGVGPRPEPSHEVAP